MSTSTTTNEEKVLRTVSPTETMPEANPEPDEFRNCSTLSLRWIFSFS